MRTSIKTEAGTLQEAYDACSISEDALTLHLKSPRVPIWIPALMMVTAITIALGAWVACVVDIDRVVHASGQIKLIQRPVVVRSLESGTVKDVFVAPGDSVRKGQIIATLDDTLWILDCDRLKSQLQRIDTDMSRLRHEIAGDDRAAIVGDQSSWAQQRAQSDALETNLASAKSYRDKERDLAFQVQTNDAEIQAARDQLSLEQQHLRQIKHLFDQGYDSLIDVIKVRQSVDNYRASLDGLMGTRTSLRQQSKESIDDAKAFLSKVGFDQNFDMIKDQDERDAVLSDLRKSRREIDLATIRSTVNGTVIERSPEAATVVSAGEPLVVISPSGSGLEALIDVANAESSLLKQGQLVSLKIDAFPYATEGLMEGRVRLIEPPAEQFAAMTKSGVDNDNSFRVIVSIASCAGHCRSLLKRLAPGMEVHADVRVGDRKLWQYFVSPAKALFNGAFTEPR